MRAGFSRHTAGGSPARAGEEGFSLVEILVAMGVAMTVLALVAMSLAVDLKTSNNSVAVNRENQLANIALLQIQHQTSAADLIFNPATEGAKAGTGIPAGFSLRILTVTSSGRTMTCEQWRVVTTRLELRSWPYGTDSASQWRTVITGVTNPSGLPPFVLASTTSYDNRVLDVVLEVRSGGPSVPSTRVATSFSATNAQFFSPTDTQFCTPTPTPGAA
ncbi:MAG: PulJ/GspJ family protein [Acidimicrobiales bacterium]